MKGLPPDARLLPVLNKADTAPRLAAARWIAAQIVAAGHPALVAAAGRDGQEPVIERWGPTAALVLAAGESRLFLSNDAGRTWKQLEEGTGLLAWPRRDRLYLLDGGGRLWLSRDGGRRWQGEGRIGGRPAALLAIGSDTLFAATHDGEIKHSSDGGVNWTTRSTP